MKALILAAGFGHRMRPLTLDRQKTLLSIGGRTIIDRILDSLRVSGITDITVVTGYRADELQHHLSARNDGLSLRFIHNPRYDKTNNIYSMALAFDEMQFDSDLVLIESDLIFDPAVLQRLLDSPGENVALVDHYRPGMDGTVVTVNDDGVITQVIPPSLQSDKFDFTGKYKTLNIYRFGKEFCQTTFHRLLSYYASVIDDNCYYELVLGMLIYMQQAEIHAEVLDGEKWAEVDDPNDLRRASFVFDPPSRHAMLEAGCGGYWDYDVLDFAFIRNLYFPPPAMLSELRFHLPELLWSYGSHQSIVNTKLAWALECPEEHVHALAGASQCYPWLRSWFAGQRALIPDPTFGEYPRIFPDAARYRDTPGVCWDEVESKAVESDVVVFVNPNNPTGTTLASAQIAEFARTNPEKIVLVDESFIDFSGEEPLLRRLAYDPLDNVVVLKSLSKCLGLPGLRLGLLYTTNPAITEKVAHETPIWSLTSMAEAFLEIMLKHRPALGQSYRRTMADREDLTARLAQLAVVESVTPSGGNFVLASLRVLPAEAAELAARLVQKRDVYVKDVSAKFDDGRSYWRLAVRTPEDHDRLAAAIESLTRARHHRPVSGGQGVNAWM
jgi:histidinol-phosphate/aromatic aminotransferase/cobyric acid decarboxylase-like protein/choline kinase